MDDNEWKNEQKCVQESERDRKTTSSYLISLSCWWMYFFVENFN